MNDSVTLRYFWTEQMFDEGASAVQAMHKPSTARILADWRVWGFAILAVIIGAASLVILKPQEGVQTTWLVGFLCGMAFGFTALIYLVGKTGAAARKAEVEGRTEMGQQVIELDKAGVVATLGEWCQTNPWGAIVGVEDVKSGLILRYSALAFLPLPDDALPTGMTRVDLSRQIAIWRGA